MRIGGTCFPKDINNALNIMKGVSMKSYVLDGVIKRNEEVDRKEKDWESDVGGVLFSDKYFIEF